VRVATADAAAGGASRARARHARGRAAASASSPADALDAVRRRARGRRHADADARGARPGVNLLDLHVVKGLEFDAAVVVEPAEILDARPDGGRGGLYTALTRSTRALAIGPCGAAARRPAAGRPRARRLSASIPGRARARRLGGGPRPPRPHGGRGAARRRRAPSRGPAGATARENIADLVDPGSFVEYGRFAIAAQRGRRELEDLIARTPADGLVGGTARVNGERRAPARCSPTTTPCSPARRARSATARRTACSS
jgi:hypothetical protein